MITSKKLGFLLAATLAVASSTGHAEVALGEYNLSFDGNLNLWDISGTYSEDVDPMSLSYTITTDPSGKFTGYGNVIWNGYYDSAYVDLYGDVSFKGTVSTSSGATRVNMSLKMTGSGTVEGYDVTFAANMKEAVEIDASSQEMLGTASGNIKVTVLDYHKSASASIPRTDVSEQLPSDVDGTWDLTLDLSTNKTKYLGTATVLLPSGRTFPLSATGNYTAKTDASRLTLKGKAPYNSINFNLAGCCTNGQMILKSLTGKVLGQSLKLPPH